MAKTFSDVAMARGLVLYALDGSQEALTRTRSEWWEQVTWKIRYSKVIESSSPEHPYKEVCMENPITWLLIANSSTARLISLPKTKFLVEQKPNLLTLVKEYAHAESRMKDMELAADKAGEYGKGTFVPETTPKMVEAENFAEELISELSNGKRNNQFRDLIIFAPPTFMGLLNKHMPNELRKTVLQQIEKDYTKYNNMELVQHLMQYL